MSLVARETVIAVEGLAARMREPNNERVAETLRTPVQELAAGALTVLAPGAVIEHRPAAHVERHPGGRGWVERATLVAQGSRKPVHEAHATLDYTWDNPREDGWRLEVAVPTLTLEGDPHRLVRFYSQLTSSGKLSLFTQRVGDDLVERLVEVAGAAFGGSAEVADERERDGRPPDHPSTWTRVAAPRFTEAHAELSLPALQERLRDPVADLARRILVALTGGSVTVEPWVREETAHPLGASVALHARARSTTGPSVAARIGYSPLRHANVSVRLELDDYRPEWHPLAHVLVSYDTRDARVRHETDGFMLLVGDALPAEWKPAIITAIGEAFASPVTAISERREIFGARRADPGEG